MPRPSAASALSLWSALGPGQPTLLPRVAAVTAQLRALPRRVISAIVQGLKTCEAHS